MKQSLLFLCVLSICFLITSCARRPGDCIDGDCQNGKGAMSFPDGQKYIGKFKNGLPGGWGTIDYPDGSKYMGGVKEGIPDGPGVVISPEGRRKDGYWVKGTYKGMKKP